MRIRYCERAERRQEEEVISQCSQDGKRNGIPESPCGRYYEYCKQQREADGGRIQVNEAAINQDYQSYD